MIRILANDGLEALWIPFQVLGYGQEEVAGALFWLHLCEISNYPRHPEADKYIGVIAGSASDRNTNDS